mgnify:CR=1 FL=1
MQTLYLDENQQCIDVIAKRISVKSMLTNTVLLTVPACELSEIIAFGDVALSTKTLRSLGKYGISLVCLNRTDRQAKMLCHNIEHGQINRRLQQYALMHDRAKCHYLAQRLVSKKTQGHINVLLQNGQTNAYQQAILETAISALHALKRQFMQADSSATLLGLEGTAARIYFTALGKIIEPHWHFNGRQKRPNRDPINALLSLTYSLVHWEIVRQCYGKGLDPYLGFFHKPLNGRESLACDGIELLRPTIDAWVIRLLEEQHLSVSDFKHDHGAIVLCTSARAIYFKHYSAQSLLWRKNVRRYVDWFCKLIDQPQQSTP